MAYLGREAAKAPLTSADLPDNAVTLAKMTGGTDGNIISYDASGDPVAIATGTDGQVLTSTGAGSPPAFEAIQLARNGDLIVKYASGSTVDIDADILTLFDSSNVGVIIGSAGVASSINLTMNQDNDSAGGGSNGVLGLDTGSFGNSTWYHLYVIYNGTTISCVASLAQNWISTTNDGTAQTIDPPDDTTSPNKGVDKSNIAGYTFGKYVGAVYSDPGGTFIAFKQRGNDVVRPQISASSTVFTASWVERDLRAFVPSTATKVKGQMRGVRSTTGVSLNITSAVPSSGDGDDAFGQEVGYIYSEATHSSLQMAVPFEVAILTPQTVYVHYGGGLNTASNVVYVSGWSYSNIV